jgi:hypothetical protein
VSGPRAWQPDEVRALGVRCSVADAASVLGLGKHRAYRLLREGRFPLPTYEVDGRTWVKTRPLRELLGIDPSPSNSTTTGEDESPVAVERPQEKDDGRSNNTRRFRAV